MIEQVIEHRHTGTDSPPINLSHSYFQIVDSVPTKQAKEGTIVLYLNGTTYRLYAMLNGAWRVITLT